MSLLRLKALAATVAVPVAGSIASRAASPPGYCTAAEGKAADSSAAGMDVVLARLFEGETDGFVAWIGAQTQAMAHPCDREMRDADLETLLGFMQAKGRRTLPFNAPDRSTGRAEENLDSMLPFPEEAGGLP